MPSKSLIRDYDVPAFYHVFNRGAGKQTIFIDSNDKRKFMSLFERHIIPRDDESGKVYPIYDVKIVAYCLMNNHYHFLFYQDTDPMAVSNLMKSVTTAYTMYFNKRYGSSGHLFQGPFRAKRITDESYLAHISRYIHMNPHNYKTHHWSSLKYYLGEKSNELIHPELSHNMSPQQYIKFLEEYENRRAELKDLYKQLKI